MDRGFDFFICCNEADLNWADWIEYHLKNAQLKIWNPGRDIYVGNNAVIAVHQALSDAGVQEIKRRMIVILSSNFKGKSTQETIWSKINAQDPDGSKRLLIPLIVNKDISINYFPSEIKALDLTEASDEEHAIKILLSGIKQNRPEIEAKPRYPGLLNKNRPSYPAGSKVPENESTEKFSEKTAKNIKNHKLGQLNREDHGTHLGKNIPVENCLRKGKALGFIVHGSVQEWPESISYKLEHLITERIRIARPLPNLQFNKTTELDLDKPEEFLWRLLGHELGVVETNRKEIKSRLVQAETSFIFARKVTPREMSKQGFLVEMLLAWQKIELKSISPSHFLLLICETDPETIPISLDANHESQWRQPIRNLLQAKNLENALLPELDSPNLNADIKTWIDQHFKEEDEEKLISAITLKVAELKQKGISQIPLLHLRREFREIFKEHLF